MANDRRAGAPPPLSTGVPGLDRLLNGGLRVGKPFENAGRALVGFAHAG